MVAVSLQHITKSFPLRSHDLLTIKGNFLRKTSGHEPRSYTAINDLSLSISTGEALGITGPNGAGKSTLLRIIAGIYLPTSGSITVQGRIVSILGLGSGFDHNLSGYDNIFLNSSLYGCSNSFISTIIVDIIEYAGLGDWIGEPLRSYSQGMILRLGFAIAVHLPCDILLLDEVLSVGDESFQKKCVETIREKRKSGQTLVLTSHNRTLLESLSSRIIRLEKGKITEETRGGEQTLRR